MLKLGDFNRRRFLSQFISEEGGCSLIRRHLISGPSAHIATGDGDLIWLAWPELCADPGRQILSLKPEFETTDGLGGFQRNCDEELREPYKEAMRRCPYLCLIPQYRGRDKLSWWVTEVLGLLGSKPCVPYYCTYMLNYYKQFFPIIDGKRVFLIAGWAERLYDRLSDRDFQQRHHSKGYEIVGWEPAPGKYAGSKTSFVEKVKFLLREKQNDFDVLMTSAGGCSVILCDFARQLGKVGFDVGASDLYILGKKGKDERWNWDVPEQGIRKWRYPVS